MGAIETHTTAARRLTADRSWLGMPAIAVVLLGALLGAGLTLPNARSAATAIAVGLCVLFVAGTTPRTALYATMPLLAVLGLLRRLVPTDSVAGDIDLFPLLPVGIAIALAITSRRPRRSGALTTPVLALTILMTVTALASPFGFGASITGLYLLLAPTVWFWAGRRILDGRSMRTVLVIVAWLAVPVACYGLYQAYNGFLPFESAWIRDKGASYVSLNIGGVIRPFSTFTAATDYATYIGIGLVLWLARLRRPTMRPLALVFIAVIGWALLIASSRTAVVFVTVAIGFLAALAAKLSAPKAAALGLVTLALLSVVADRIVPTATGRVGVLLSHQFSGLADPFDNEASTAGVHADGLTAGIRSAIQQPLGHGIGAIAPAGQLNTEADPSNVAVAGGLIGLLLYCWIAVAGGRLAYVRAREHRDLAHTGVLIVLTVTTFQWFNGAQYAASPLVWLALGWLDAESVEPSADSTRES